MGSKKIVCHLNANGWKLRGRKCYVSNVRDVLARSTYRGLNAVIQSAAMPFPSRLARESDTVTTTAARAASGVVSARGAGFTAWLAAQRSRRAGLEQEILLVERQLSGAERQVIPEAVARPGEVIVAKLRAR